MTKGIIKFVSLFFGALLFATGATAQKRPNILFISIDDLRPELGCYGSKHIISPNIDKLADAGTVFERAYCQVPVCGASRASMMTGLYPTSKRFVTYYTTAQADAPGIPDIPKWLQKHGYTTISNGKIYHEKNDNAASWDELFRPQDFKIYHKPENVKLPNDQKPAFENADVDDSKYAGGAVADKAIKDLQKAKQSGKPFFLALGFTKPHLPFNAPKKYWDMYNRAEIKLAEHPLAPVDAPKESIHQWNELRGMYGGVPKEGAVSDDYARSLIHGYYACISYSDALVGKVLAELDRLELRENTIILLCGDHGWQLGDHSMWCKHALYKTSLRTPLIISAPGLKSGKKTTSLVEFVDIYPTLCELAGIDLPKHLQGKSVVPILKNPAATNKEAVFSRYHSGEAVKTERFHYAEWPSGGKMLYDHSKDPGENVNIVNNPEYKSIVEDLSKRLDDHRKKLTASPIVQNTAGAGKGPQWQLKTFKHKDALVGQPYMNFLNWRVNREEKEKLIIQKVSGPGWLSVTAKKFGKIEGTPNAQDLGMNVFIMSVSDGVHPPVQARMEINVLSASGEKPVPAKKPVTKPEQPKTEQPAGRLWKKKSFSLKKATVGQSYSSFVNWQVTAKDKKKLVYAKVSGPDWLSLTHKKLGRLEGAPTAKNVGKNTFVISVSDGAGPPEQVQVTIVVE